ncbi:hypothetical protein SDC9_76119 [bioreactor metagenome]|uniref:Uncharacterized protein n=1 Tax=bioreactor metagenome TaxID=1076179 RepID=A0A644YMP2_9ZZZZ
MIAECVENSEKIVVVAKCKIPAERFGNSFTGNCIVKNDGHVESFVVVYEHQLRFLLRKSGIYRLDETKVLHPICCLPIGFVQHAIQRDGTFYFLDGVNEVLIANVYGNGIVWSTL